MQAPNPQIARASTLSFSISPFSQKSYTLPFFFTILSVFVTPFPFFPTILSKNATPFPSSPPFSQKMSHPLIINLIVFRTIAHQLYSSSPPFSKKNATLRPSSPPLSKKMLHPFILLYHSLQKCNALFPTPSISLYLQLTHYFGKVAIISDSIPAVEKVVLTHYRGSQV